MSRVSGEPAVKPVSPNCRRPNKSKERAFKFDKGVKWTGKIICKCDAVLFEINEYGALANFNWIGGTKGACVWIGDDSQVNACCRNCGTQHHLKMLHFKTAASMETIVEKELPYQPSDISWELNKLARMVQDALWDLVADGSPKPLITNPRVSTKRWVVRSNGIFCSGATAPCGERLAYMVNDSGHPIDGRFSTPLSKRDARIDRYALGPSIDPFPLEYDVELYPVGETGRVVREQGEENNVPSVTPYELHLCWKRAGHNEEAREICGRCLKCGIRHDIPILELRETLKTWIAHVEHANNLRTR